MIKIKRTQHNDDDFLSLVSELDLDLKIRDGDDHAFFAKLNTTNTLNYMLVAYYNDEPAGCGALRKFEDGTMEIKRMYVRPNFRRHGIASKVLSELEDWCSELQIKKCILETGIKQPEAISLYRKHHYKQIPNYGHYANVKESVCFEKLIR